MKSSTTQVESTSIDKLINNELDTLRTERRNYNEGSLESENLDALDRLIKPLLDKKSSVMLTESEKTILLTQLQAINACFKDSFSEKSLDNLFSEGKVLQAYSLTCTSNPFLRLLVRIACAINNLLGVFGCKPRCSPESFVNKQGAKLHQASLFGNEIANEYKAIRDRGIEEYNRYHPT